MIVPRNRLAQVEALAAATANAVIVGDPQSEETILGPIANQAQFNRVQAMIEVGLNEGAKLLCGGPGRVPGFEKGFRSEERRVGKEGVSTGRFRWSPIN